MVGYKTYFSTLLGSKSGCWHLHETITGATRNVKLRKGEIYTQKRSFYITYDHMKPTESELDIIIMNRGYEFNLEIVHFLI